MTLDLATPGVRFVRERTTPAIATLRTDIAAFVGLAERGPDHRPIAVESFEEFKAIFGGFSANAFLAYAVKAFFDNGGQRARIVRVTSDDPDHGAMPAGGVLTAGALPSWFVVATSPGQWANAVTVAVQPGRRRVEASAPNGHDADGATIGRVEGFERGTHVRLSQPGGPSFVRVISHVDAETRRVYWRHPDLARRLPYDAQVSGFDRNRPLDVETLTYSLVVRERGRVVETHVDLVLVPEYPRSAIDLVRVHDSLEGDRVPPRVILVPLDTAVGTIPEALDDDPTVEIRLTGGWDGFAALRIEDFIGDPAVSPGRGLEAVAPVDEVAILAMPDIHVRPILPPEFEPEPAGDPCDPCAPPDTAVPPTPHASDRPPIFSNADILRAQAAMAEFCERRRDCFAILDAPYSAAKDFSVGLGPVRDWRGHFDTAFAALYFPWASVADPVGPDPMRAVPPCGHVAGQMARLDLSVGVHRPPANVPLNWVPALTFVVSEGGHGVLNPLSVNVLRAQAGQGLRVLGARTLSSDPAWRYVNVRRLISMIRKALDIGSQWAVFEPNNGATRATLAANVSAFLLDLWRRGSFVGATPEASFSVRCDETNNPPERRSVGELHVDVAVAPVSPFEFVVLRLGRVDDTLRIDETIVQQAGG